LSELGKYNPELLDKRRLLAISKCDLMDDELRAELEESLKEEIPGVPFVLISSISGLGITQLKDLLWQLLNE
jgi:GTP-binding protein